MSVSTELLLNPSYRVDEIILALRKIGKAKILAVHANTSVAYGFYSVDISKNNSQFRINIHTPYHSPLGTYTLLSAPTTLTPVTIFADIAKALGGLHAPSDATNEYHMYAGNLNPDDKLFYHLRQSVIKGGTGDSIKELDEEVSDFSTRMRN